MTQTSELVAGRELDAAIAEKVMGEHVHDWQATTSQTHSANKRYACSRCGARVWGGQANVPARYSTDIAAAWQVVARAKYVSLICLVSASGNTHDGEWSCTLRFARYNDDASSGEAREKTAPLAICRAALAAVGA